uniref:Uncharacterized protein n=1 Tax=Cacopsylla melanoneura TaxID=428564 RepID=A0A8D9FHN6_9HEMI
MSSPHLLIVLSLLIKVPIHLISGGVAGVTIFSVTWVTERVGGGRIGGWRGVVVVGGGGRLLVIVGVEVIEMLPHLLVLFRSRRGSDRRRRGRWRHGGGVWRRGGRAGGHNRIGWCRGGARWR